MSEESENKKLRINWSPEKVMSISALFVSMISLIALFYQLSLAREENKLIRMQQSASVLPHMSIAYSTSSAHRKISFINKGVGPAFIKEVEFRLNNQEYHRSDLMFNEISRIIKEKEGVSIVPSTYSFQKGEVIPANQEIDILTIRGVPEAGLFIKYMDSIAWEYRVVYEDIYGARWKLDQKNDFPVPISDE